MEEKLNKLHGEKLLNILSELEGKKIIVLGDIIADEFVYGTTERISREAPVLILRYQNRIVLPGGAGNAARNIRTLGGIPISLGVIGNDDIGRELVSSLDKSGVDLQHVEIDDKIDTVQKTRLLSGGTSTTKQQVIRIDRGGDKEIEKSVRKLILDKLKILINEVDGILVSDYDCGLISNEMAIEINEILKDFKGVKIVDSRYNMDVYKNFTLSSPNEEEAFSLTGYSMDNDEDIILAGQELLNKTGNENVLLTRGAKGMVLFSKNTTPVFIPITREDEIADVTGAGDTVAATVTLALASGVTPANSARLANIAGGVKVRKRGTATVSINELRKEINRLYKLD